MSTDNLKNFTLEELEKLAKLSNDEIYSIRREYVKKKAATRLREIARLLEEEKFKEIDKYIQYSSSGDGYGSDNYYISFNDINNDIEDIHDLLLFLGYTS